MAKSSTHCKRWYLGRRGPNGQETQVGRQRLRADIEVLERRREFIVRLQELRTDIRTLATKRRIWRQRSRPTSRLRNADKTSLFSRTRLFFNEIVDEVIGHKALLSVVVNQAGHLDYRAELLDDAGIASTPCRSLLGHVPTTYRMAIYRNCVSNVKLSLNDRTVR